jgi:hypothetical protein
VSFLGLHVFQKRREIYLRMPGHITELLPRIEAEERENYPNIARYKQILLDAKSVYADLNGIILEKEHAREAIRIRETIERELAKLSVKIRRNMH